MGIHNIKDLRNLIGMSDIKGKLYKQLNMLRDAICYVLT